LLLVGRQKRNPLDRDAGRNAQADLDIAHFRRMFTLAI
jgi:hypothetical protein